MNIVCVGDCGIDHYLPSGNQYFGGITANFARHARDEFGTEDTVHIVSCVGDDKGADIVLAALDNSGIECHLSRVAGATPVQFIEIQADGERQFVRYDEGVLPEFHFSGEQEETVATSDLLVAPVYLQIVGLFDRLMEVETRGQVAIDFADFLQHPDFSLLQAYIDKIDVGFFGLTASDSAAIDEIARLAARHNKLFIVTLGRDGSRAFHGRASFTCRAAPVDRVVDTTGAGDAYAAALLGHYCRGVSVQASMDHAASLASTVIAHAGAYTPAAQKK